MGNNDTTAFFVGVVFSFGADCKGVFWLLGIWVDCWILVWLGLDVRSYMLLDRDGGKEAQNEEGWGETAFSVMDFGRERDDGVSLSLVLRFKKYRTVQAIIEAGTL